jgi:surfeit locus 1 family protein
MMALVLFTATALFVCLGVWQIERRAEKLALIAMVEGRVHKMPTAAPGPPAWRFITTKADAYRRVYVHGVFRHDRETLVQAATQIGPGYWVMTPLQTDAGWSVLINRGFVPAENRARFSRRDGEPHGRVTVTGLLRMTEPKGAFLHTNDPWHDHWYSRDVFAIGRTRQLFQLAPYFIDASQSAIGARQPIGGLTVVSFPNNHLQYALTWFALAGLSLFGLVRIRSKNSAERGAPN